MISTGMNRVEIILIIATILAGLTFLIMFSSADSDYKMILARYPLGHEYLLEVGVEPNDIEDCYRWALGIKWGFIRWNNTAQRFRDLHPEVEPPIRDNDRFDESWRRIGKLYLKAKS